MLTQNGQDDILKELGSVFRGTPNEVLPTDMGAKALGELKVMKQLIKW
jgi:hypothetical protein